MAWAVRVTAGIIGIFTALNLGEADDPTVDFEKVDNTNAAPVTVAVNMSSETNTISNLNTELPEYEGIDTVAVKTSWRDVLALDISDPDLQAKTERFLDFLEKSAFIYKQQEHQGAPIVEHTLTGQDILNRILVLKETYNESGIVPILNQMGLFKEGKFTISSHNRFFDGTAKNGSYTVSVSLHSMQGRSLAMGISLGTSYLKGAQYLGADGKHYPVTVEGVLVNELAHIAYNTNDDRVSNDIENIITVPMGAQQRDFTTNRIEFTPDSNGGYQSLISQHMTATPSGPASTPGNNPHLQP